MAHVIIRCRGHGAEGADRTVLAVVDDAILGGSAPSTRRAGYHASIGLRAVVARPACVAVRSSLAADLSGLICEIDPKGWVVSK